MKENTKKKIVKWFWILVTAPFALVLLKYAKSVPKNFVVLDTHKYWLIILKDQLF